VALDVDITEKRECTAEFQRVRMNIEIYLQESSVCVSLQFLILLYII